MATITEQTQQSENVIAVVRKEGMSIAPDDTQCIADVKGKRCKTEITFNMINHTWSQMCEKHDQQNEDARANVPDVTKVLKFVGEEA